MAIDYETLLNWRFEPIEQDYKDKDTILYALGVGLGSEVTDESQLRYVYEENLAALPAMATVLGYPGFWLKDPRTGVDWKQVLHGEQFLKIHIPLPATGKVVGENRVTKLIDKGEGRGAVMFVERSLFDVASGDLLCTLSATTMLRGDGGFGGPSGSVPKPHRLPTTEPELTCDLPTLQQAALIYRLSGDRNPLHIDPQVARLAGFERPILHGLSTYGVVCHAVIRSVCNYQPERLRSFDVRFSSPVYPGETIRTEMWVDGNVVSFRARVVERDVVVLNNGRAEIV
jgi:acyl dehydratase